MRNRLLFCCLVALSLVSVTAPTIAEECGDGVCTYPENHTSCPADCESSCGDGICDGNENGVNCPGDCPTCGNATCDRGAPAYEDETTCPQDCLICDGNCANDWTCQTCFGEDFVCEGGSCELSCQDFGDPCGGFNPPCCWGLFCGAGNYCTFVP